MILAISHWSGDGRALVAALGTGLVHPVDEPHRSVFHHADARAVKTLKKDENTAIDAFQQALSETLDALQQVRAANQDTPFFRRILGNAQDIKRHSEAFTWKSEAASRISFLIFLVGFDISVASVF